MLFCWCRNPIITQAEGFFNSTPQNCYFPAPRLRFPAVVRSQLFLIVSRQGRAARAALFFRPRQAGRYWMRTTTQRKERTPDEARSRAIRAPTAPASDAEANKARSARDWLKPMPHRERTSQQTAGESENRKATAQEERAILKPPTVRSGANRPGGGTPPLAPAGRAAHCQGPPQAACLGLDREPTGWHFTGLSCSLQQIFVKC